MPITRDTSWVALEVSKRPLKIIAQEMGVSTSGLSQYCKRHKIAVFGSNHFRELNNSESDAGDCPYCGTKRKIRKYSSKTRGLVYAKSCPKCNADRQKEKVRDQRRLEGQCIGCGREPLLELKYCARCRDATAKNKKLRGRLRKTKLVNLMGGECGKCGGKFCDAVYDFHHTSDDKQGSMNKMMRNNSWEAILAESKKCVLVCANCHRLLHNYKLFDIGAIKNRNTIKYRRAFVQEKRRGTCCDCRMCFDPRVMDFDHRDPATKLFDISDAVLRKCSLESLILEIRKCDLVCANCHRVRTHGRI